MDRIEVDIGKRLGDFTLDARFTSAASGITALFGRSGSGKTSLVNALAGLIRPDRGQIVVRGEILFSSRQGIDLPPERRRLGYVFQEDRLFPHYSVRGNLRYGMKRTSQDPTLGFDHIVELLDLRSLLDRHPRDLSGGEKQRVAIGRALLADPRLLLMDEPLASLDIARKNEIIPFIERLRDELRLPIVYVTHAMEEIIRLADTLVLVSEGKVAATGTVEDLTSRMELASLTGRYEAGAVIRCAVTRHDPAYGLAELTFPGGTLRIPQTDLPLGLEVRARIRARDVALALERPAGLSIRNVFPAKVTEIAETADALVDVRLDIGQPGEPVALWSRITRSARDELGLSIGMPVHALVKTVALDRGSLGR